MHQVNRYVKSITITHGADAGYRRTFSMIAASEVFSLSMSKMETFRRSIGIRIKKKTEVVEGAIVESQIDRSLAGATNTRKLTIKTTDIQTYEKMIDALLKEKGLTGDVRQVVW
ncbi:hypothetical protein EV421DRAFT_1844413 [Armillaria borealis]|uniref:RuvB-like helicase n=1 Tax=Armillaria borealis TaxID=47425 RepID=A0AA39MHD4_9AGAR|nr:hypothetical protein EV421DRAFT_1864879 [Armillaria borealis]KAK0433535.1 hypothetical protein EV421DRAFT_1844413 [Armillaria borealis]